MGINTVRKHRWKVILSLSITGFLIILSKNKKIGALKPTDKPQPSSLEKRVINSHDCNATFGETLKENVAKIQTYNFSAADKYFRDLDKTSPMPNTTSTVDLPIIVTAASSNHYLESIEMLESLGTMVRLRYPTIPLYYYDLGLTPEQTEKIKAMCNCKVVQFPFDKFPDHVRRLKAYCWKPIIIKMMLGISRFVMWMDASIQFKISELEPLFSQAKQYGVIMYNNQFSLPAHVHQDTFSFLGEEPCLFEGYNEYHAGLILFHTDNSIIKNYILDPWVKCALIEACMKTRNDEMKIIKCRSHKIFHSCHRFDQAILSILIFRLFHDSYRNHNINIGRYYKICYNQACQKIKFKQKMDNGTISVKVK